ncbi:MAG: hypothetical protein AMXMBFR46_12720 [Acidimicrobiia bacterium]
MTARAAVEDARTGDVWLFRGPTVADRAIRLLTNAPVNHVAMAVALDDLPPLLWHTELGQSLPSVWTGEHQRGAQLHRLDDALAVWTGKYRQRAWVRNLDGEVTRAMEDALLQVIAEYDGRAFPRTRALVAKWLTGRLRREASAEAVYCAELLAITYTRMGLLEAHRPANWFDPGRFWSGDRLELAGGASLGPEIEVLVEDAAGAP